MPPRAQLAAAVAVALFGCTTQRPPPGTALPASPVSAAAPAAVTQTAARVAPQVDPAALAECLGSDRLFDATARPLPLWEESRRDQARDLRGVGARPEGASVGVSGGIGTVSPGAGVSVGVEADASGQPAVVIDGRPAVPNPVVPDSYFAPPRRVTPPPPP